MKFSKRTKGLAATAALFGVGALVSTIHDLNDEVSLQISIAQAHYNRSTDLEKYIYNTHGPETLAALLNLSVDTVKEFGQYIYS